MIIYMTHPLHGRMPVYSMSEKAVAEQRGWSLVEDKPVAPSVLEPEDDIPKRRGRPPKGN